MAVALNQALKEMNMAVLTMGKDAEKLAQSSDGLARVSQNLTENSKAGEHEARSALGCQ